MEKKADLFTQTNSYSIIDAYRLYFFLQYVVL